MAVQFILFNFANYSPSIAMELKLSKEITCINNKMTKSEIREVLHNPPTPPSIYIILLKILSLIH